MIRWLSQLWVSSAIDRGDPPPKLWRWTFGRLASHRRFASQLSDLDAQLRRQAASQQRSIAHQPYPTGDYPARRSNAKVAVDRSSTWTPAGWLFSVPKPALALGLCLVVALVTWMFWPTPPAHSPQELPIAFEQSFERLWNPISEQAKTTSDALREQTLHVTQLPDRLPKIDQVVQDFGQTIENPIRQEMQRFTRDMTRPWLHLANQLPLPAFNDQPPPSQG